MLDAVLLYNPAAGRVPLSEQRLDALLRRLERQGIRCQPAAGVPGDQLLPPLDLSDKQLLVVCGGDGTIHQAIQHVAGTAVPMALLPAGTANVLARELGIPLELEAAVEVAARGRRRRIRLGEGGGRYFHLMAGVGLDARIVGRLNKHLKRRLGVGAFWVAGLTTLALCSLEEITVEIEGEKQRGSFVVLGNARNYGGNLLVTPKADVGEDCLDVCLFTSQRKMRFFQYLAAARHGSHVHFPDVIYRKVREARVTGPALPVQMDGELVGTLPLTISVFKPGIEVIVP